MGCAELDSSGRCDLRVIRDVDAKESAQSVLAESHSDAWHFKGISFHDNIKDSKILRCDFGLSPEILSVLTPCSDPISKIRSWDCLTIPDPVT